jgi:hypothetical protein
VTETAPAPSRALAPGPLTPDRAELLEQIARAGPDGVSLAQLRVWDARVHPAEEVRSPEAMRQLVGRLEKEDGLVVKVPGAKGVYRALVAFADLGERSGVVVRASAPDGVPTRARELPEYDVTANAGGYEGRVYDLTENSDSVVGRYFVDPREVASIPDGEAFVVRVFGTSMVPDFHPGDRVVCRRYNDGWAGLTDGHYLIRIGSVAYVKTLQRLPRRRFRVISTNEAGFPPFEIDLNDGGDSSDVEALAIVFGHFKRYWE